MAETKKKKAKKPTRFLIVTENEAYGEKTFGIQFNAGKALLDEAILPGYLNRTLEEVVAGFKDMPGYEVTPLE